MSEIIEEAINSEDKKVDFSDDEILMDHRIEDLFYGHHPGLSLGRATSIFRSRGQLAYFLYINRVTKYLFVAIYMDWTILFRHPVNFFLLVIFFATSISLLFVAGIFIPIYTFYRYCTKSEREPVINVWGKIAKIPPPNRNLINDLMEGMKLLGNNTKRTIIKDEKKIGALGERENLKRVSKLKSLLFFSTLVYKRESKITYKIQGCVRKLKNIEHKIRDMIGKDEKKIKEQIKEFDLNFTSISELNTDDGGSFCGMFWSDKENFIIIAFKGTTPTNFAEWLGNLTFQCVDARNYLFGQVHRGFYNYLFPLDEESAGKNYPCQKIIESINCKATTLKNMNGRKVNLWITGHSLGGALATLFYARLLNINYTHESWELQGAITFASPAVGDINFSTQLAALINDPRNLAKPLWRIVLNDDIVPKMPYRACNKRMRKYGYHYNVLMNYAQVGDKVTFYGNDHDPTSIKEFFSNESDKDDNIGEHVNRLKSYCKNYCKKKKSKPLGIFRHRHGSNSYFKALIDYEKKIGKK
ncbi:8720_t:CDS:2 [Rhizophagus irregularis]|nr:8720_t:CDS:2 [Rhizophagus irregularis]